LASLPRQPVSENEAYLPAEVSRPDLALSRRLSLRARDETVVEQSISACAAANATRMPRRLGETIC
jgi:hypothetical protein